LQAAQNRMAQRVNAHRRELEFNPGDLVLLSNLRQPGPGVKKLKPLYLGLFQVESMVGNIAMKLNFGNIAMKLNSENGRAYTTCFKLIL